MIKIKNYQLKKPFISFLPGIAGLFGKPLWSFYANRGQLITSFGYGDKNRAILEFYPANSAYMYERVIGFKTFIKIDGKYYSFFNKANEHQTLFIERDKVAIEELNHELGIKVKITYFTLPNYKIGALSRLVEITNLKENREIEILDGLTQILPSGIDYGGYKAVGNLLQSWMDVLIKKDFAFYKLRGSTDDSTIVKDVVDGNFFISKVNGKVCPLIVDSKKIFKHDTNFQTAHGFIEGFDLNQVTVNQVPSGFVWFRGEIKDKLIVESLYGYANDLNAISELAQLVDGNFLTKKSIENEKLINETIEELDVETNVPILDQYFKQNLLDNLLRGGKPYLFKTKEGEINYHLFSRKHGDPERDYNFFYLEPNYFSQGNGNFRDVLQNRRNDNFFYPDLKEFNIIHFASFIQKDGYNPLSIEGIKFLLDEEKYSPGERVEKYLNQGLSQEEAFNKLKADIYQSTVSFEANFGEGFWGDHFTYFYDLIENYLRVYPDKEKEMLFSKKIPYFQSPVRVKPRNEKTFLEKDGKIRQHHALLHFESSKWSEVKVNVASKILTLILNKYYLLDNKGLGVMYEADKPGWNDALNGLPALFGSGISETIEIYRLTSYFLKALNKYKKDIFVIAPLGKMLEEVKVNQKFESRMVLIEEYRLKTEENLMSLPSELILEKLEIIKKELEKAINTAKNLNDIIPTYLTYEVIEYKKKDSSRSVTPLKYQLKDKLIFLEAPARLLKIIERDEAEELYEKVKKSDLYDALKMYKTSGDLNKYSHELGRIRMFTKGWLERESNFLHMTYKYLFGLLKAGLYQQFYQEIKTNFTCFMDINVYGRSILENSSFIATSNNPDSKNHGRGFVARLSGSTAEALSIYTYLFFGERPFRYIDELEMHFEPIISKTLFKDGKVKVRFYNSYVSYFGDRDIFKEAPNKITIKYKGEIYEVMDGYIKEKFATLVRSGEKLEINVYFK
ncbi:MAG: hypothetical protein RBS76_04110 [Acholeplasmatales bacterium]|jgi:hypothetical protein|nr:hypothetical protein [Acholeplasmataceae bacterium]MDY0115663.1 hypothetical protein [Acholeplasmatales bacterium]MCK9289573.1 hypothetical protein [Acholeplasmataceae bacterium]MCK9428014.1 hypothetical protein [Acholeplasmataceae bacterium]MDD4090219.1 hypothetical protein [Acholeplasmataceae bacterium]